MSSKSSSFFRLLVPSLMMARPSLLLLSLEFICSLCLPALNQSSHSSFRVAVSVSARPVSISTEANWMSVISIHPVGHPCLESRMTPQ